MGRAGMRDTIDSYFQRLAELARVTATELSEEIVGVAELTLTTIRGGHKLLFCGNGGSAADAQHLAAEYVVRFQDERRPLPAIALTTDTSILTAASNDYGYDEVFARQVRALGTPGDLLFLHSTSGRSPNLIRATEVARELGLTTVALLARDGGTLRESVDQALVVPTDRVAHAQEIHLAIGHLICSLVEAGLFGEGER